MKTGDFIDPAAEKLLGDVLIKRRDKIGRVYFSRINPLVRFELTDTGLTFENPAVKARLSEAPTQGYQATWYRFNNGTGAARPDRVADHHQPGTAAGAGRSAA